jgi:hypothetical protein
MRSDAMRKLDSMIAPRGYERWINGELLGPKKSKRIMKEVSNKEIRDIAVGIVTTTSESTNDFDAVDDVEVILKGMFSKMDIAVESLKKDPNCKCKNCGCDK